MHNEYHSEEKINACSARKLLSVSIPSEKLLQEPKIDYCAPLLKVSLSREVYKDEKRLRKS